MADVSNQPIWFGTNGQNWVVASVRAPFFCTVAESERAVEEIATRALRFYIDSVEKRDSFNRRRVTISPEYVVQKKVLGKELAA
jgi:hypothetical protein